MLVKYAPSGRFSPLVFALVFPGVIAGAAVAWVYQFAEHWIPLIYVNAVLVGGFAYALGYISRSCIRMAKCRRPLIGGLVGLTIALGGFAAGFFWLWDRVNGGGHAISFWRYLQLRVDAGLRIGSHSAGSGSGIPITGFFVYLIWAIEGAVLLLTGFIMGSAAAGQPFCETCNAWADSKKQTFEIPGLSDESIGAVRRAQDIDVLLTPPLSEVKPSARSVVYEVRACPVCDQVGFLTSRIKSIVVDRKGKAQTKVTNLHDHLVLSKDAMEAVAQLGRDVAAAAGLGAQTAVPRDPAPMA